MPRTAARRSGSARTVQAVADDIVELARVDPGRREARAADAAAEQGIALEVDDLPEAKRGFVLLPRRWIVERSSAWATRFGRLVQDCERHVETLAGRHVAAFACPMTKLAAAFAAGS